MVPTSPADYDDVEASSLRLNIDLAAIAMHHRYQPLLPFDDLAELPQQVIVPLEDFAVAVDAWVMAVEALLGAGAAVLLIRLEEFDGVASHVNR